MTSCCGNGRAGPKAVRTADAGEAKRCGAADEMSDADNSESFLSAVVYGLTDILMTFPGVPFRRRASSLTANGAYISSTSESSTAVTAASSPPKPSSFKASSSRLSADASAHAATLATCAALGLW